MERYVLLYRVSEALMEFVFLSASSDWHVVV